MNLSILRRPFVVLLTVPAGIALLIGIVPLITIYLEKHWLADISILVFPHLDFESGRTALSVVAGGAMTALSLTYSLVLVVFTLAAGNIGPRMLKRFSTDLVNQITAGIFGGTFLYALLAILFVEKNFVPNITITLAGALAVLCVMQLIYFVRHVSRSVTIDDEIAEITDKLKTALENRFQSAKTTEDEESEEPENGFKYDISAGKPGYFCSLAENKLIDIAVKEDFQILVNKPMGGYTLSEEPLFKTSKELDEELVKAIQKTASIQSSRSEDSPIEFSINLLLEVALRALSPGINDTFTAIAAVDSLSNALSNAVVFGNMSSSVLKDEEGTHRIFMPEFSVEHLINQAFSPLRRAAANNILMSQTLAHAYARLYVSAREGVQDQLKEHALLLIRGLKQAGHFEEDINSVLNNLPKGIRDSNRLKERL